MTNIMRLTCLFITRPYSPDNPELLVAWDEYSIDNNNEGFTEECDKALKAVGDDILNKAYVTVNVDEDAILKILLPSGTIEGVIND